jgi:TolA-binding protein
MYRYLLATLVFASVLIAESSVFGAGDINSDRPYGLSSSEKELLKNRKLIQKQAREIENLKVTISELKMSMDGMRSIIEGIGRKVSGKTIEKNSDEIQKLKIKEEQKAKADKEHFNSTKLILAELTSLVDSINTTYVQKSELKKFEKEIISVISGLKKGIKPSDSSSSKPKKVDYTKMESAELLKVARSSFQNKKYDLAETGFKELVKRGYKPALSSFYLGELNYYQGYYTVAIENFKLSIAKNDKASYIPTLLLHVGNAFNKLGDTENAKRFFGVLQKEYPKSKEAETSKTLLKG